MRPINHPQQPAVWPPKDSLTFGGQKNIAAATACLGGYQNVPLAHCLNLWLEQVKGVNPTQACAPVRDTIVSAIKNQVNDLYKQASVPLTEALGAFCSYCGTPLSGLLEVEHAVPKADYPTYSVTWDNLLLSCGPCNNAKSDDPKRATVRGWLNNPNPTEQQYYDSIRDDHYVWPDLPGDAYDDLLPELQYLTAGGAWQWIAMDHATNYNNFVIGTNIATRTVRARIFSSDNATSEDLIVRVAIDPTGDRAEAMNALCGFNEVKNPGSTYDRRMMNRTLAWFTCLGAIKRIAQTSSPEGRAALWEALKYQAVAVGFYSVWVAILEEVQSDAATSFVQQTNHMGLFPGTNTAELP